MSEGPERNKAALQAMFEQVLEAPELDTDAVARHFSPDYIQRVNGEELDYAGFVEHMRAQKQAVAETDVSVELVVAEGAEVCDFHKIHAVKRDGGVVEGLVMSHWRFGKDGRIAACTEVTHMVAGAPEDRDLGSRS